MKEVTLIISEILEARSLNISEFQVKTGLSYRTAHGLATGRTRRLDLTTIAAVCEALDVEPGELFKLTRKRARKVKAS